MPRFRERPHVSCDVCRDRALGGRAPHGQIGRVGFLFRSLHLGLLDIETRSEPLRAAPTGRTPTNTHRAVVKCVPPLSVPMSETQRKARHRKPARTVLKLRPSGLGSGIHKDRADYAVYCGRSSVLLPCNDLFGDADLSLARAATLKCLAARNKSGGPTTKRRDNNCAQILSRQPMLPARRTDPGYREPLLLPPTPRR